MGTGTIMPYVTTKGDPLGLNNPFRSPGVYIQTVYTNPLSSSGYDPDGIQSLLNADEIDWDAFDWDGWSWVVHPDLEGTPSWDSMSHEERAQWYEDNESELQDIDLGGQYPHHNDDVEQRYEMWRASGKEGGTEINFEYYAQDPFYNLAFDNLDIEFDEEVGLTEEHLQVATKYLVETFRTVMNDGYREPWDAELPETWQPKAMTTDYETPFAIPGIVSRRAAPTMSKNLEALRQRSGSHAEVTQKIFMENTPTQPGFKGAGNPFTIPEAPQTEAPQTTEE